VGPTSKGGEEGRGREGKKKKKEKGMKGRRKRLSPRRKISGAATANNRANCQLNVCYCRY